MKGDDKELRVPKMTEKLAARFRRATVTQTEYRNKMRSYRFRNVVVAGEKETWHVPDFNLWGTK